MNGQGTANERRSAMPSAHSLFIEISIRSENITRFSYSRLLPNEWARKNHANDTQCYVYARECVLLIPLLLCIVLRFVNNMMCLLDFIWIFRPVCWVDVLIFTRISLNKTTKFFGWISFLFLAPILIAWNEQKTSELGAQIWKLYFWTIHSFSGLMSQSSKCWASALMSFVRDTRNDTAISI